MKIQMTIAFLLCTTFQLLSQTGFETKTVSIFKNNSAFFVKNGTIVPKDKHHIIKLDDMPLATYGTFWLSGENLKDITFYEKEIKTPLKPVTVNYAPKNNFELLEANIGQKATIRVSKDDIFKGIIRGISQKIVFVEQSNGEWLNLPIDMIKWVTLEGKTNGVKTITKHDTLKEIQEIADISFENNNPQNLDVIYFQNGINWIPSYKIELLGDDKGKITMQAAVLNYAEDLKDVNVNFVVGYPNIKYADQIDMFWKDEDFAKIENQEKDKYQSNNSSLDDYDYIDVQSRAVSRIAYVTNKKTKTKFTKPSPTSTLKTSASSIKGESEEDLYFYTLKNVTIPKGGKGYFSVFESEIPVVSLYDVSLTPNHTSYYRYQPMTEPDPYRNKVWHTLLLENTSSNVWTTASAMVVKKDGSTTRPISQDDLSYTSKGGKTNLKLTVSPDISVVDFEQELSREPKKRMRDGYHYELVKVKGEVNVQNFKSQDIKLSVKKTVIGRLSNVTQEHEVYPLASAYSSYNQANDIRWELELKPGEKRTIKYEYEVYARK